MRTARFNLARDRRAVGGFLEASLAMMVITAGVALMMLGSTVLLESGSSNKDESALVEFAEAITKKILTCENITLREEVLLSSSLYLLHDMALPSSDAVQGFRITLRIIDRTGAPQVLLGHGSVPNRVEHCVSLETPVDIAISLSEVRAAILVVLVW